MRTCCFYVKRKLDLIDKEQISIDFNFICNMIVAHLNSTTLPIKKKQRENFWIVENVVFNWFVWQEIVWDGGGLDRRSLFGINYCFV